LHKNNYKKGTGIAIGIAIGTALGVALGNIAIGISLGLIFGILYDSKKINLKTPIMNNKQIVAVAIEVAFCSSIGTTIGQLLEK
jgi:hypothetical protein